MQRFGVQIRRGMTLVELLVVIGIIATLAAVTIPIMVPAVESRRMREAARGVSTFIAGARARAVELNRPVGIRFEPLENEKGASMAMFYVEQPAPFAGWSTNATGTIAPGVTDDRRIRLNLASENIPADPNDPTHLVRRYDLMKLNFQGYWYQIDSIATKVNETGVTIVDSVVLVPMSGSGVMPWREDGTERVSYQIFRQPIPAAGQPYQLPEGIVVDLHWSGIDSGKTYPREVIFAPSGQVIQVRWSDGSFGPPKGAIYLLVGKRENIVTGSDPKTLDNPKDANCLWVTINNQNGQSKAVENSATDPVNLDEARRFARDEMALGGR